VQYFSSSRSSFVASVTLLPLHFICCCVCLCVSFYAFSSHHLHSLLLYSLYHSRYHRSRCHFLILLDSEKNKITIVFVRFRVHSAFLKDIVENSFLSSLSFWFFSLCLSHFVTFSRCISAVLHSYHFFSFHLLYFTSLPHSLCCCCVAMGMTEQTSRSELPAAFAILHLHSSLTSSFCWLPLVLFIVASAFIISLISSFYISFDVVRSFVDRSLRPSIVFFRSFDRPHILSRLPLTFLLISFHIRLSSFLDLRSFCYSATMISIAHSTRTVPRSPFLLYIYSPDIHFDITLHCISGLCSTVPLRIFTLLLFADSPATSRDISFSFSAIFWYRVIGIWSAHCTIFWLRYLLLMYVMGDNRSLTIFLLLIIPGIRLFDHSSSSACLSSRWLCVRHSAVPVCASAVSLASVHLFHISLHIICCYIYIYLLLTHWSFLRYPVPVIWSVWWKSCATCIVTSALLPRVTSVTHSVYLLHLPRPSSLYIVTSFLCLICIYISSFCSVPLIVMTLFSMRYILPHCSTYIFYGTPITGISLHSSSFCSSRSADPPLYLLSLHSSILFDVCSLLLPSSTDGYPLCRWDLVASRCSSFSTFLVYLALFVWPSGEAGPSVAGLVIYGEEAIPTIIVYSLPHPMTLFGTRRVPAPRHVIFNYSIFNYSSPWLFVAAGCGTAACCMHSRVPPRYARRFSSYVPSLRDDDIKHKHRLFWPAGT